MVSSYPHKNKGEGVIETAALLVNIFNVVFVSLLILLWLQQRCAYSSHGYHD